MPLPHRQFSDVIGASYTKLTAPFASITPPGLTTHFGLHDAGSVINSNLDVNNRVAKVLSSLLQDCSTNDWYQCTQQANNKRFNLSDVLNNPDFASLNPVLDHNPVWFPWFQVFVHTVADVS